MERSDIAGMNDLDLENTLNRGPFAAQWGDLCREVGQDAPRLLQLACRVAPSNVIAQLAELEAKQAAIGAGFLGMLPDQIPDDLIVPHDTESSFQFALQLAQIRNANLQALAATMPQYVTSFLGNPFQLSADESVPHAWELQVDVGGIRAVLDFFAASNVSEKEALQIARMPAFTEMMKHRRELGYVPEPLIDADGLAWCLFHAASTDPIAEIWKWLHPQNLFDLSDLYAHQSEYRAFIDQLDGNDALSGAILSRIGRYASGEIVFRDQLSFAVGWGIRGWATTATGGVNIEHLKDNYVELLPTLIHETFHRLQAKIALPNPDCDEPGFERVTSYPFEGVADRRLYQALCYIMLEGTATYVASGKPTSCQQDAEEGLAILGRIRALEDSKQDDAYDTLLSEALRSNGPFYGFGALLSDSIVKSNGESSLGVSLQEGAPSFIRLGFESLDGATLHPSSQLVAHIQLLEQQIRRDADTTT